jgi:O-acetyl-ADP-ribose deacetylase (regulator of RNase III)
MRLGETDLEVVVADITTLKVDAIVNAANAALAGGGGVDGAIHRAAGPKLLVACRAIGGCPTGEVRMTPGFDLAARFVIHAVGPVWQGGGKGEPDLLASCYRRAIEAARSFESVAFPAISTGIYGFPADLAAHIAVQSTKTAIAAEPSGLNRVIFCCFSQVSGELHRAALQSP